MSTRITGVWLTLAALLFWVSWALMPGVGITNAAQILDLVSQHRPSVAASVVAQLISAACYAPALVGLLARRDVANDRSLRMAATLLLIGAMGSAADAVFHLLAYAMTAPGFDRAAFVGLMEFMQGPGLRFVLPLIASYFIGAVWLSLAFARRGLVSRWNPGLYGLAVATGIAGAGLAPHIGLPSRIVGLAVLALVAGAQVWIGVALARASARTPAAGYGDRIAAPVRSQP